MRHQLDGFGLDWEFLDAVIGKDLNPHPPEYDEKMRLRLYGYPMSPGEMGCFMSHRLAWLRCSALQQPCLILEDDTEIQPSFARVLDIALANQSQWDLFRMHGIRDVPRYPLKRFDDFMLLENLKDPSSSAAYLCSPASAERLLGCSSRFAVPIDDFLEFRFLHHLRIWAVNPYPIHAGVGESTITGRKKPPMKPSQRISREFFRLPMAIKKSMWRIKRRYLDRPTISL